MPQRCPGVDAPALAIGKRRNHYAVRAPGIASAFKNAVAETNLPKQPRQFGATATARDAMNAEIHCCREDEDPRQGGAAHGLPVINKSKRMIGMLSLGDVSHSAPVDLLSECIKSISAHHH
jgi:hypothetical protein